jgi:hypothetical protein
MLKVDLWAAGLPYRDAAGLVRLHSLRCQTATLADQARLLAPGRPAHDEAFDAGVDGRYTRPRAVDLEDAARSMPTLRRPRGTRGPGGDGTDEAAGPTHESATLATTKHLTR